MRLFFLLVIFSFFEEPRADDSICSGLNLEQKIGQLFIVPACPLREGEHREDLRLLIEKYHIGGILLKQGTASSQLQFIEQIQQLPQVPLICVQDGEWGVGMRLIDVISFPKNLTLGAIQNEAILRELGKEIGKQCKFVGAHLNLAPVVDVNLNPKNPIIHMRSFGEDSQEVALKGMWIMEGIQSMGVMACAKHFPGHGDTAIDSHIALPTLFHDMARLKAIELQPFKQLINRSLNAVMSAHLSVPALTGSEKIPATFSHQVITKLLKEELGFKGLVLTDALNMKALSSHYSPEEIAVNAFLAGHDLLLYGDHIAPNIDQILREEVPRAFDAIKEAVYTGAITEEMLEERVCKILQAKQKLGLFLERSPFPRPSVIDEINSKEACALKRRLFQEAITVVRNENQVVPLNEQHIVFIEWGEAPWFKGIVQATGVEKVFSLESLDWIGSIDEKTIVILSIAGIRPSLTEFGMGQKVQECLFELASAPCSVIAALFGTPYSLAKLPLFDAVIVAYENEREAQEAMGDILFGLLNPKGNLPVSILPHFPKGTGLHWKVN